MYISRSLNNMCFRQVELSGFSGLFNTGLGFFYVSQGKISCLIVGCLASGSPPTTTNKTSAPLINSHGIFPNVTVVAPLTVLTLTPVTVVSELTPKYRSHIEAPNFVASDIKESHQLTFFSGAVVVVSAISIVLLTSLRCRLPAACLRRLPSITANCVTGAVHSVTSRLTCRQRAALHPLPNIRRSGPSIQTGRLLLPDLPTPDTCYLLFSSYASS